MKKDFRNVLATFSLIALVLTGGALAYQKKEYGMKTQAAHVAVLTSDQLSASTKAEQDRLAQIAEVQKIVQSAQASQNQNTSSQTPNAAVQADLARAQAVLDALRRQQQTNVTSQNAPQTNPQPRIVVVPSRRSRAS